MIYKLIMGNLAAGRSSFSPKGFSFLPNICWKLRLGAGSVGAFWCVFLTQKLLYMCVSVYVCVNVYNVVIIVYMSSSLFCL